MDERCRVLFLSANPRGTTRLALDKEFRLIKERVRASRHRDSLELIVELAVRPDDVLQALNEHRPNVVHFSAHGSPVGELLLEDEDGRPKSVRKQAIEYLFKTLRDDVRLVLFNACFSKIQAEAVVEHIDCAVGMSREVGDEAAIHFAAAFYRAIGFGRSVQEAFDQATTALMLDSSKYAHVPQLLSRQGVDPRELVILKEFLDQKRAELRETRKSQPEASQRFRTDEKIAEIDIHIAELARLACGSELPEETSVVPKGLRSFDEGDAGFFLNLLPGPFRPDTGLPESIHFWKTRLEETDAKKTFRVGLLYGPSGCGKSSLVRAGLVPSLDDTVTVVYVEAMPIGTDAIALTAIQREFPDAKLASLDAALHDKSWIPPGQKIVLILDQFEQYLHTPVDQQQQLVDALRQCDGANIQCVIMARDDFITPTERFFKRLGVKLAGDRNYAVVDLFSKHHAERVLNLFGRAYGALPRYGKLTTTQSEFAKAVVDSLAEEHYVICVRLALFAQMVKDKEWTPSMLKAIGGPLGIGVAFLEESFSARTAPLENRRHQKAAQELLRALLPEPGASIKGTAKSRTELLRKSGYTSCPREFAELMTILDKKLRLITPIAQEDNRVDQDDHEVVASDQLYQLTHDYIVPSLSEWLTWKQKETRRGRAELRLVERSALWNSYPENRHLPSLWEYVNISLLTTSSNWTDSQRRTVRRAGRIHRRRFAAGLIGVLIMAAMIQGVTSRFQHRNLVKRIHTAVAASSKSRGEMVASAIEDLKQDGFRRDLVLRELRSQYADASGGEKLGLAYALAHFDDGQANYLARQIKYAPVNESKNLIHALKGDPTRANEALISASEVCDANADWSYKARLALVALHLGNEALAARMCRLSSDPIQRTTFIDELRSWHGDLAMLSNVVVNTDSPGLRSALSLGLGAASENGVSEKAWEQVWTDWYQNASDSGTHSASRFALERCGVQLLEVEPSSNPHSGKEWWQPISDLTMVLVPPGKFERQGHRVRVRAFWISDREVSRQLFLRFLDDKQYSNLHANEMPAGEHVDVQRQHWRGHYVPHASMLLPVEQVTWFDAAAFCNWLSRSLNRVPYYVFSETAQRENDDDEIDINPDANGFRLPTEAQWEYACRAGTTTEFSFGNNEEMAVHYSVFSRNSFGRPSECGSRMCNGWGLFDMHGNMAEWCDDVYSRGARRTRGGDYSEGIGNSKVFYGTLSSRFDWTTTFRVALLDSEQAMMGVGQPAVDQAVVSFPSRKKAGLWVKLRNRGDRVLSDGHISVALQRITDGKSNTYQSFRQSIPRTQPSQTRNIHFEFEMRAIPAGRYVFSVNAHTRSRGPEVSAIRSSEFVLE